MPVVPRFEPQVKTDPLQTPRAQGVSPDAFGYGVGKTLQGVSQQLLDMAKEERQKEELTALNDAKLDMMKFDSELLDGKPDVAGNLQGGLLSRKGTNAQGLEPTASGDWRKKFDENIGKLQNFPSARTLFKQWGEESWIKTATRLNQYELKERQETAVNSQSAINEQNFEIALQDINAGKEPDLKALESGVTNLGQLKGLDAAGLENLRKDARSKVFASAVQRKLDQGDTDTAAALFDKYGTSLEAKERHSLEPVITKIKEVNTAKSEASTVWEKMKPRNVNEALSLDAMREKIRNIKGSDQVKELAEKKLESLASEYLQQKRFSEEGASNKIYDLAINKKQGYEAVVKAIYASTSIDDKSKSGLLDWADSHYRISEKRNEAKQAKKLEQLATLLSFQQQYLNGDYGTLQPAQVARHASQLGEFTDNAMQFVNHVNTNLGKAKLTDSELNDTIRILRQNDQYADLLPAVDKSSETDKAKLALLQGKVQELMNTSAKEGPGKGMSVKEALLKSIQQVTTDKGYLWDTKEPMYVLGSDMATGYGKEPASWPKETQDKVIEDIFYRNPANKSKKLTPQIRELYRRELVKTKGQ